MSARAFRALLAALLVSAGAGCGETLQPLTQLVVLVDSDLKVPSELDALNLEVTGVTQKQVAMADLSDDPLPRSVGLVNTGTQLGPITVSVTGLLAGKVVVQRMAIASFQKDKSLLLRVPLLRACVMSPTCDTGSTCDAGHCASAQVTKLSTWNGQVKPFVSEAVAGAGGGSAGSGSAGSGKAGSGAMLAAGSGGSAGRAGTGGGSATNRPPTCAISSPKNSDSFAQGDSVMFSGSCSDPEAGTLTTGLLWESDRDMQLATTERFTRTSLSVGTHKITLCATDPSDAKIKGCAMVSITVTGLPTVRATISSIMQGSSTASPFTPTDPIVVMGSVSGADPVSLVWTDSLSGAIGSSPSAMLSSPLVGKHYLTLTAIDSRLESATDARSFLVLESGKSQLIAPFSMVNQTLSADGSSRVDVLSSASISVYASAVSPGKLYHFNPTENPSTALPTLVQTTAPALIRDVFLPAASGSAYVALSAGYQACVYAPATGIDASMCTTFQGVKLPSDDTTRALRFKAANALEYLLVGTNKGLFVSDLADTSKDAKFLTNIAVTDLANDESAAWIASADGLYTYDLTATNPVGASPRRQAIDAGGPGNALTALAIGTGGVVWVGGPLGIARFVPATGVWTGWRAAVSSGGAPTLASNEVRAIAVARDISIGGVVRDVIWIATAAGVSRFDPNIGSFTNFSTDDGLPNNSVQAVVVLINGDKVFATDSGVALYKGL